MPTGAPTRCSEPGCSVLCPPGRGRCSEHMPPRTVSARAQAVMSDPRYRQARAAALREHPVCQHPGCTLPSQEVDHIVPVSEGGAVSDPSNLQALCSEHHDRKSAIESFNRKNNERAKRGRRQTRAPRDAAWIDDV